MNKFKTLLITSLAAGSIALGGVALAERGDRGEKMVERISSRLSLDDNQSVALATFADSLQASREATGGRKGRAAALQYIEGDTLDQGAALAAIEARAEAMRAAAPQLVANAAAFYDGLDAEQREQVREFLEKGGKRRSRR